MNNLINSNNNFIFISPHLDDAIFSCGGLIDKLHKKGKKITIINVFTKASKKPYTLSIKKFLKSCGYTDAHKLYKDRISEDINVAKKVNAKVVNLNFVDALWRRKNTSWTIPELNYVYPIFRLTIAKGFISKHDKQLIKELELKLSNIIKERKNTAILCPSGIGNHTDHLITRNVVNKLFKNVVFWEDFPYSETSILNKKYFKNINLHEIVLNISQANKDRLIKGYKTQLNAIFGKKLSFSKLTEKYYIKNIHNIFPVKILDYNFVTLLNEHKHSGKYIFALYRNKEQNTAILKMWMGDKPNLAYFWLKNEISSYNILDKNKINIPKLIYSEIKNSRIIALYEYINGANINNLDNIKKAKIYSEILSKLQISANNKFASKFITNRPAIFWILMMPVVTLKALYSHPSKSRIILKSFSYFIGKILILLTRDKSTFVHRDLNDNNIILANKNTYVIDFELSCIGDPLIDFAIIYLKNINNTKFLKLFSNTSSFKYNINSKYSRYALTAYIIVFAMYDLGNKDEPHELDFTAFQKFVINKELLK